MIFDLEKIKDYYDALECKIKLIRKKINFPLTLTEKILYSHLVSPKPMERGKEYADFNPDRVAMQDATAQMALLQFMMAGKNQVEIPTSGRDP